MISLNIYILKDTRRIVVMNNIIFRIPWQWSSWQWSAGRQYKHNIFFSWPRYYDFYTSSTEYRRTDTRRIQVGQIKNFLNSYLRLISSNGLDLLIDDDPYVMKYQRICIQISLKGKIKQKYVTENGFMKYSEMACCCVRIQWASKMLEK